MLKRLIQRWKDWWEDQEREMLLPSGPKSPQVGNPKYWAQMVADLNRKVESPQAMADLAAERGDSELAAQIRSEIPSYQVALEMTQQKLAELLQEYERTDNNTEG